MDIKNINFTKVEDIQHGIITGYASVFDIVDQHNDLIIKGAFKNLDFKNVKFLWQHNPELLIGKIESIEEDNYGLKFTAKLLLDIPQAEQAYALLKADAISGFSIGFKAKKFHYKQDIRVIEEVELWEISLVTFPANEQANILEIKKNYLGDNMRENIWENFQQVNEQRLKEVKNYGRSDPLLDQQLTRINHELDDYKARLDNFETSLERPFASKSNNFNECEYKKAFGNYLRAGIETNLSSLEKKALSASSDADGGYLLSRMSNLEIVKVMQESSPMRQLCENIEISTNSLDLIDDYENAFAGWTAETKPISDTSTPRINKRNIPVFEIFAQPSATQKLIDDSAIDIEKWLAEKLISSFSKLEDQAFINGDGIVCPRGILTYQDGNEWGQIQQIKTANLGLLDTEDLFNLYFSLKQQYCSNASFLLNRITLHQIRTLKDQNTGKYLWTPSLSEGNPDTLLGVPVHQAAEMPVMSQDTLVIALADFKQAYKIVDRMGIRVLRDPYTLKPFVKFYTSKRVGGDVSNFEAIKLLKVSSKGK